MFHLAGTVLNIIILCILSVNTAPNTLNVVFLNKYKCTCSNW